MKTLYFFACLIAWIDVQGQITLPVQGAVSKEYTDNLVKSRTVENPASKEYVLEQIKAIKFPEVITKEWVIDQINNSAYSDELIKTWVRGYVSEQLKTNTSLPPPPPILDKPVVDTVKIKDCPQNFAIKSVTAIALKGIQIEYTGDVAELECIIMTPSDFRHKLKVPVYPKSSKFIVGYPNFPKGNYILMINGISCNGTHTKEFTVK